MKLHLPCRLLTAVLAACVASVGSTVADDRTWNETSDSGRIISDAEDSKLSYPTDNGTLTIQTNGYTISICQDAQSNANDADAKSGSDFAGNVIVDGGENGTGGLYLGQGTTSSLGTDLCLSGNVLGSGGTLELINGAQVTLSMTQKGTVAFGKAVSMENGTTFHVNDGNYTISSLSVADGSSVEITHSWGKTLTYSNLNAAGATLQIRGSNELEKAWVNFGGGTVGTIDNSNINTQISGDMTVGTINIGANRTLRIHGTGQSFAVNVQTINMKGGSKLLLHNGYAWNNNVGATGGSINIDASADSPVTIAGTLYGPVTVLSNISGTGIINLQKDEEGWSNPVNLNGIISGDLGINVTDGTYNFNAINTYGGSTIINGGTVTVGAEGSLGTGNISMTGGTLAFSQNTSSAIAAIEGRTVELLGGTLASGETGWSTDSAVTLGAVTLSGGASIGFTGNITLTGTVSNELAGGAVATLQSATTITADLTAYTHVPTENTTYSDGNNGYATEKFLLIDSTTDNGNFVISKTVSVADSSKTYEVYASGTQADLGEGFIQGTGDAYIMEQGSDYFVNEGTVTYSEGSKVASDDTVAIILNGGNLAMERNLNTAATQGIILHQNGGIALSEGVVLNASSINAGEHTATLSGEGCYTVSSIGELNKVNGLDNAAWAGDVRLQGVTIAGQKFNYGNANSTVTLAGVTGHMAGTGTSTANLVIENYGNAAGLNINDGHNGTTQTFSGKISGTGNIGRSWVKDSLLTFKFTGDVSEWTGNFDLWQGSGSTAVVYAGNATEINNGIRDMSGNTGRSYTVTIENDNNVTVNSDITGNFAVTYRGSGVKTVNSDGSTYTGGTTIESGEVKFSSASNLGNGNVTLTGGTLHYTGGTNNEAFNAPTISLLGGKLTSDNGWYVLDSNVTFGDATLSDSHNVTFIGGTGTFNGDFTNEVTGNLRLNFTDIVLAEGALANITRKEEVARTEGNGFGQIRYYLVDGSGITGGTIDFGADVTTKAIKDTDYTLTASGNSAYIEENDTTYYVNENGTYDADMRGASTLVVNGATMTNPGEASGSENDYHGDLVLSDGTVVFSSKGSFGTSDGAGSITLVSTDADENGTIDAAERSNNTIQSTNSSLYSEVSGQGNLTLERTGSSVFNICTTVSHEGDLTLKGGDLNVGDAKTGSIANTGKVIVQGTIDVENNSSIANTDDVEVQSGSLTLKNGASLSNGGNTKVTGEGQLIINSGATVSSTIKAGEVATIGARPTVMRTASDPVYTDVVVTADGISSIAGKAGSVSNAAIDVTGAYAVTGTTLTGTTLTVSDAGTLTLTNVTMGDGSTLVLNGVGDSAVSVSGMLTFNAGSTLDLSKVALASPDQTLTFLSNTSGLTEGMIMTATGTTATVNGDGSVTLSGTTTPPVLGNNLITSVVGYDESNNILTFKTDMAALSGDVALTYAAELWNGSNPVKEAIYAETGSYDAFYNPDGLLVQLTDASGNVLDLNGVTSLTLNGYAGIGNGAALVATPDGNGAFGYYYGPSIPEPTTTTLSLLALAALAARRRRK